MYGLIPCMMNFVRTDNPSITYLGQIYDPYFGTTSAEFVSQMRIGAAWDHVPFTIDSVKLVSQIPVMLWEDRM